MALTKTPIELSSTPSIVDGGNATAITIGSDESTTFAEGVNSNAAQGNTAFYAATAGSYIQTNGASSNAMAFGMTGGNASPATAASTSFGFHHWNNSSWATPVSITRDGITFNGDTAEANALDDYEEGTWTPTVVGGTQAVTVVSASLHKDRKTCNFKCLPATKYCKRCDSSKDSEDFLLLLTNIPPLIS